MASKSRRIANVNGAAVGPLRGVPDVDLSKGLVANAVKQQPNAQQKAATQSLLAAIKQFTLDAGQYQLGLDAKQSDVTLGRMASLLDEFQQTLTDGELAEMKKDILDAISNVSTTSAIKSFLASYVASLFDNAATRDDVDSLKEWMQSNFTTQSSGSASSETQQSGQKAEEQKEDEEAGDFKDSTPAKNFDKLQSNIQKQFDSLNKVVNNITGSSGIFSKIGIAISGGFAGVLSTMSSLKKSVTAPLAKVGTVIKAPFAKVGNVLSKLNPFAARDQRRQDKKQKAREDARNKMMDIMSRIVEKIWKVVEPFVDKVAFFMSLVTKFVVVPIALIAAQVLLIVAAIALIGVGLYLAYKFVKAKISKFIDYIKSGQLWEDIKSKIQAAWEWTKDLGKWMWGKLVDFGMWYVKTLVRVWKFLLVDIPVWIAQKLADFGVWIWEKLKEFGAWLYDSYIDKYVVQPLAKLIQPIANLWVEKIQPKIQPFLDSLLQLKDTVFGIFKGWDTSKSIWENLKNMASLMKDAVVQWWDESPFKTFYEANLKPFVDSAKDLFGRLSNLGGCIKGAIMDWWNGDSSLGESIKNIGSTVWNTVADWWKGSVFKEKWMQFSDYLNDMAKPIRDWYETSSIKKWIDKAADFGKAIIDGMKSWWEQSKLKQWIDAATAKVKDLLDRLGNTVWDFPGIPLFRPFGFLVGKTVSMTKEEKQQFKQQQRFNELQKELDDISAGKKATNWRGKDITTERKKQIEAEMAEMGMSPRQVAAQQVQNAVKPLQQLDQLGKEDAAVLKQTSEETSKSIAQQEEQKQEAMAQQRDASLEILKELRSFRDEANKKLDDPAAIPVPVVVQQHHNSAIMEDN